MWLRKKKREGSTQVSPFLQGSNLLPILTPGWKPRKSMGRGSWEGWVSSLSNEDRVPSWGEKDKKEEINRKNQHSMTSPSLQTEKPLHFQSMVELCAYETKFAFSPFHEESLHIISEDCLLEDQELQISSIPEYNLRNVNRILNLFLHIYKVISSYKTQT